jgi:hypothetical protein
MRSSWRRIADFADTRAAAVTCFVAALAVYGIESIAWPLRAGRDGSTYLEYYVDMWHAHPAYPFLMLFRTPLAPLFFGVTLQIGGPILAEVAMAFAFATSVLCFALVARRISGAAAVVTAVALLVFPAYGALFHQVSSDPVFALTLALWALALARALEAPRTRGFIFAGVALVAMVLARPGAEVLLVSAVVPLVLKGVWRRRLVLTLAYAGTAVALLVGWASYNGLRYGDFTVARGSWAGTPFYRTFVMEKIVQPGNGPASRELAQAVRTELLTRSPYKQHHVTAAQFFSVEDDNMWDDMVVLSDRVWGWDSNYTILRRTALEAIRKHPGLYAHDVASGVWSELTSPYRWDASHPPPARALAVAPAAGIENIGGNRWWLSSTPSGRRPVQSRIARQYRQTFRLIRHLPDRSGSTRLASVLNGISRIYPRMLIWILVGLAAAAVRRSRALLLPLALVAGALLVILVTLLGYGPTPEYNLPFDPVYVLFGVAALFAPRALTKEPMQMRVVPHGGDEAAG